jgi:alpha-galactosidase
MTKRIGWLVVTAAMACLHASLAFAAPVKVFILAGQSNMVGYGKTINGLNPDYDPLIPQHAVTNPREIPGGIGSLTWAVQTMPEKFGYDGTDPLVDSNGNWLVRDDVNVYARLEVFLEPNPDGFVRKGPHAVGFGKANSATQKWNGPDYGFGHVVGNALDDEVLIIKVATGGTSLDVQWLSPTAAARRGTAVGYMWPHMVSTVNNVLANLETEFPEYAGEGYEIAGFGWHQGYNDRVDNTGAADRYEANMADFIADVRSEFGTSLPFVIANTGMAMPADLTNKSWTLVNAQNAMVDFTKYPGHEGNVALVNTVPMYRDSTMSPSTLSHHWNHNGISYYEIGAGMGAAMLTLLPIPEPSSLVLAAMGLGALLRLGRRRKSGARP